MVVPILHLRNITFPHQPLSIHLALLLSCSLSRLPRPASPHSSQQESIFRVVAAILHLGNITFKGGTAADSSKLHGDKSKFHLEAVAELLRCEKKKLRESLLTRTLVTRDGNIKKDLDPAAAVVSRDTLAKTIYSRLFDWLVDKVNKSIGQDPDCASIIGVLDIYGFETFQFNSFEQFCINLANEKLQQHFNQHVFKAEQEEYEREEIDWSYIEFVDNQDVLELIEKKPMGIISLLDEQCMFPKSNAETFATKLYQTCAQHPRFEKPKLSQTDFTINHYAGQVTYQSDLFLDKNKDYVVAEHQDLLGNSKDPFVVSLFPPSSGGEKAKTKFTSLGSSFKQQLAELMASLGTTEPHYVRCVKPNSKNRPGAFENQNVIQQLRCGGVLEAIRISCAGYPTRRSFDEFLSRFSMLAPDILLDSRSPLCPPIPPDPRRTLSPLSNGPFIDKFSSERVSSGPPIGGILSARASGIAGFDHVTQGLISL
ncbi:unnamed protein product [Closterium sp. NIES-53]